jgi:predicted phage tail protein
MLRTTVLHGELAEFGPTFRFDVASAAQAVRALVLQIKGFRAALERGHYRITRIRRGRPMDCDMPMLRFPLGGAEEIHIAPVISGAGSPSRGASTGKVIAGAALVALAAAAFVLTPAGAGAVTIMGLSAYTVGAIGLAVAISGISGLLTKAPQGGTDSFILGGQDNVTTQGGPVPLPYGGPVMCGSVTISAGLFTDQLAPGTQGFNPELSSMISYFSGTP